MFLRAELATVDRDDTAQRRAQDFAYGAFAAWRAEGHNLAWGAALQAFGTGSELNECPALAALFQGDPARAAAVVDCLIVSGLCAVSAEPLCHVPLRHGGDAGRATLLLGQAGDASLALVARSGAALAKAPAPTSATFSPARQWLRVIAGSANAALVEVGPSGAPAVRSFDLAPGDVLARDALREALHFKSIPATLVTLELTRRDRRADVARELALADGALLRQSASDPRDSRLELMAALLGRMGRTDAAPTLAALAQARAPMPLRWQALREALALDTRAGFAALGALAQAPGEPLAAAARDLRARLITDHPQLRELALCPG